MVARLITPVLAAYSLTGDSMPHDDADGPVMTAYLSALRWCALHRWKTVAMGCLWVAASVAVAFLVPTTFMPPEDFANAQLSIELPPGGTLEDTARVSAAASAILRRSPEVTNIVEFVGSGDGLIQNAAIYVSLVPRNQRSMSQKQWEQRIMPLLNQVPDGNLYFSDNGGGRDLQFYLTGDDPPLVEETAHRVIAEMQDVKEIRGPRIRGDLPRPEIIVHPRFAVAAQLGVSVQAISQTIRIATLGDLPQNGAKFSLSDRQIPIRVSLVESARRDLTTLENLPVPTSAGGAVPLKTVADLSFGQGPSAVRRYNQTRRVFIEADLSPGVQFGTANKKVYALPTLTHLPQGVHLVPKGDSEYFGEMIKSFALAIGAGILMVLAVLVLLFVRVFQPLTILSALPLSLGGAALALVITGQPFSLAVLIGFLMLMGIVAKNSILLVDFAIEEMRAGKSRMEALVQAGHKRARPIVMTSVAMVAGMLPVAIGWGGDSEFRAPMAIAVIGGLLTSTVLTLVVVPAVFTILDDFERWLAPRASRLLAPPPGTVSGEGGAALPRPPVAGGTALPPPAPSAPGTGMGS
jgi:multidrug efflux pump subunit AcrB